MLCVSDLRVVALLADLPADRVPDLMQVLQRRAEHRLGVAPHLDMTFADFQRCMLWPCLADKVAESGQSVLTQKLHDFVANRGAHLDQDAQLFIEQCLEREFIAARADLACPVFAVAGVHAAVGNAITFDQQHVDVERHADLAGKGHLASRSQQAAVTAVVVSEYVTLGS